MARSHPVDARLWLGCQFLEGESAMRLDEFDRLNLHDDVRYRGQLHSVVHINRRTGNTYLRPTPGYGGIVGPISFADISGSVIQDPRSDSWGGTLISRPPVIGAPVDDDSTIEFLPAS